MLSLWTHCYLCVCLSCYDNLHFVIRSWFNNCYHYPRNSSDFLEVLKLASELLESFEDFRYYMYTDLYLQSHYIGIVAYRILRSVSLSHISPSQPVLALGALVRCWCLQAESVLRYSELGMVGGWDSDHLDWHVVLQILQENGAVWMEVNQHQYHSQYTWNKGR